MHEPFNPPLLMYTHACTQVHTHMHNVVHTHTLVITHITYSIHHNYATHTHVADKSFVWHDYQLISCIIVLISPSLQCTYTGYTNTCMVTHHGSIIYDTHTHHP